MLQETKESPRIIIVDQAMDTKLFDKLVAIRRAWAGGVEESPDRPSIEGFPNCYEAGINIINGEPPRQIGRHHQTAKGSPPKAIIANNPDDEMTPAEMIRRIRDAGTDSLAESLTVVSGRRTAIDPIFGQQNSSRQAKIDEAEIFLDGLKFGLIDGILPPLTTTAFKELMSDLLIPLIKAIIANPELLRLLKENPILGADNTNESDQKLVTNLEPEIGALIIGLRRNSRKALRADYDFIGSLLLQHPGDRAEIDKQLRCGEKD